MINYNCLSWCLNNMERGVYSPLSISQILAKTHHLRTKGNLTVKEFNELILRCETYMKGDD